MRGPQDGLGGVILRARVGVADQKANRRAKRHAVGDSREQLDLISFLPLRGEVTLTWTPAIHLRRDRREVDLGLRRATVDDGAKASAVRLAKGRHAKRTAKGVAHAIF